MGDILQYWKQHRLEHLNSSHSQISYTSLSEFFNLSGTQYLYLSNWGVGGEELRKSGTLPLGSLWAEKHSDILSDLDKITPSNWFSPKINMNDFLKKGFEVTSSVYPKGYFLNRPLSFPECSLQSLNKLCPSPFLNRATINWLKILNLCLKYS